MAAEHGAEQVAEHAAPSATDYINHHMTHLTVGEGFWTWHVDTLIMSAALALVVMFVFGMAARQATTGVPGRFLAFIEVIYGIIDNLVGEIYHGNRKFLVALAMSLFTWIIAMNTMDLLPLDLPAKIAEVSGNPHAFWRILPSADLMGTVAMALVVLVLFTGNAIRVKGLGGYGHEWLVAPFGIWLAPANILFNALELVAKPFSLAMRLFGNMFAGELVFMLIALLGLAATQAFSAGSTGTGVTFFAVQLLLGAAWAIFHILIVLLQAYIFTVLPIVYISMAEEHH
jgi:F-type H+-transporting ATPase subunit a